MEITPKKEKKEFVIKKTQTGKYTIVETNVKNTSPIQEYSKDELNDTLTALNLMYDCEIDDSSLTEPLNS